MKKSIVLIIVALISLSFSHAQRFEKRLTKVKENAVEFQNRTLLVVLKEEKKEENVRFNSYLKKAFDSEWDIHENVMFVTKKEYKKFRKDDSKAFFIHQRTNANMMITTKSAFDLGNCDVNMPVVKYGFDFEDETTLGDVYRQIQKIKHQVYGYINLDPKHAIPTRQVRKTQGQGIDQRDAGETIKNMTLYIDKETINDDFKANLDKLYNYDYKLVTHSEINKAIIENNGDIAFIENGFVVDADEGDAIIWFGSVSISGLYSNSENNEEKLNLEDLKSLAEVIN